MHACMFVLASESTGQGTVHPINWLADNVPKMKEDFEAGVWNADELLVAVLDDLSSGPNFYHGSHTLIHLSRDLLRYSDCFTEDTGAYLRKRSLIFVCLMYSFTVLLCFLYFEFFCRLA